MPASELGDFLRTCRAAVAPGDVGLPDGGGRRVPGLRREEVAQLVGLSTDYYVRLEQGRGGRPSASVLDAIARTLALTEVQRAHLHDLAGGVATRRVRPPRPALPRVGPGVRLLLDTIDVPAVVMTTCTQVVAWNALGARMLCDFGALEEEERNAARLIFSETDFAARHAQWDVCANELVGILRLTAGREPGNLRLQELVGELACSGDAFRRMWAEHQVAEKTAGLKAIDHPEVGRFDVQYQTLRVAGDDDLMVVTYTAEPGTRGADALALLRTLVADEAVTAGVR